MDDIQKDVDLMNKVFSGELSNEPEPEPEPGPEPEPTDIPDPEPPSDPEPSDPEPPAAKPEPEPQPEPEPKPDDKDSIIESLRARVAELESARSPKPEPAPTDEPEPKPKPEPPKPQLTLEEQDFIGDLDVDDLVENKEGLNKLLNAVYAKAVSDTQKVVGEGVLKSIPDIVKTNIITVENLRKASEEIYNSNEDLKPFKKVVAAVFEEIASENPDKPYTELMDEVADETRSRLELVKKATDKTPNQNNNSNPPRLPQKKSKPGNTRAKPQTNSLLNELEEMNKTLGR